MISAQPVTPHERSLRLIIDNSGTAATSSLTENVWVATHAFSQPTWGNTAEPLTTGKQYFAKLIEALKSAQKHIYITGWQVNWDAQLDDKGTRLFDILLEVARKGTVQIYVMPWNDTAPVQTYDDETQKVLEAINDITQNKCVHVNLAKSLADSDAMFYSHHQKLVVVDNKIAFVGGIDLAYGRFDDETYNLAPNASRRVALNRYNGCVEQVGIIDNNTHLIDPDLLTGLWDRLSSNAAATRDTIQNKHGMQAPADGKKETLDSACQPRMPWQDVHSRIQGPAVADLARNFVIRWNSEGGSPKLPLPETPAAQPIATGCGIQVLRSAPAGMTRAERDPISGAQANIHDAMQQLIDKAQHFIYIENQFFVSAFGLAGNTETGDLTGPAALIKQENKYGIKATRTYAFWDVDKPPQNKICECLGNKIKDFILHHPDEPFHVYITLPVHPEGKLSDGSIMTQVHWTMQSLVFGSQSLMNRIRRALKARELINKGDADWSRVIEDNNTEYDTIPMAACDQYLTLLNLRNHAQLGNRTVTEQIYVHSKLMIVDDRFALLGSANINDRSLLGSRDSELAVLVVDSENIKADLCGDGKQRPTRAFARNLRMAVWNKLFGITAGGSRAATALQDAVKMPAAPQSWKAIQDQASANTTAYEAVFDFIPRNKDVLDNNPISYLRKASPIWPRWHDTGKKDKDGSAIWMHTGPMPFDADFWKHPQFIASALGKLNDIKGFITRLPIEWTKDENNNLGYPTALVAKNTIQSQPVQPVTEIADNKNESSQEQQT